MLQVDSIFIFCDNTKYYEQWAKDYPKIKGVYTEIAPICDALKQTAQQCEQNSMSISFVVTDVDTSKKNLDQLDPIFMYTQVLKEILLTIKFDDGHIKQYTDYCCEAFAKNETQLKKINNLQTEYRTKTPIWWVHYESCLFTMLNCALRLMDVDIIIKMGFLLVDLHRQIEELHSEQFSSINSKQVFTVYRGQGMSKTDFDQMKETQGGLLSFNNFLSTSKDRQVSRFFAESNSDNLDLVGILFVMTIDPMKSTTPFASVANVGHYGDQEGEVLFSMHTVFRIGEITSMDKTQRLFQVQLTLINDNDNDLRVLTDRIREETKPDAEGWSRLGLLLIKVGESAKAQHVYEILLEQTTDVDEKVRLFDQLGWTKYNQGEYNEAITFYEKALEIYKKSLSFTDLSLAKCYNNIGAVYSKMGDYPKALSYYEKPLEIRKRSLPSNHPDLGASYSNIGLVYTNMGDHPKALSYSKKVLEIRKKALPSSNLSVGMSYDNIGLVYFNMGNYPKALSYYEKAFKIKNQSLPSNHPDLGSSYNNIGNVYYTMGDYPTALSCYEKALDIKKKSLPSNHPNFGNSYNNIGTVYDEMGDYPTALSYYEKALEIKKKTLPLNHPSLGASYNNIGHTYYTMGDYPKALSHYEKALEISKQSLPSNHLSLATTYNNIGNVYYTIGDYPTALSYYEKDLVIIKESLTSNCLSLAITYNNNGTVYYNTGDYPKALSYYKLALTNLQGSLPFNHGYIQNVKDNIDMVKKKKGSAHPPDPVTLF